MNTNMKIRTIYIILAVAILGVTPGCHKKQKETSTEIPPVSVQIAKPETGTITLWHSTTCELASPLESKLSFPNGGRITDIAVQEGDAVAAGQYLAQVDVSTLQAQYSAAVSSAESARMQADAADIGVQAIQNQIELAQANLHQAQTDYDRMVSLHDDGVATQSELEQAQLRLDSARIGLQSAQDQADAAAAQAAAYHTGAMAAGDQARQISEMIDDGILRAPYSGRIVLRKADPGTIVAPGATVLEIIGEGEDVGNHLEVRLSIPESISSKVRGGTSVFVKLPSCENEIESAVARVNPVVQTDTRTIELIAYISFDSGCVLPGMFGTVRIPLEVHDNALLLPETAVLVFPDVSLVYVAVNNAAVRKEVTTGILEGGNVEILSGLDPDDDVIVVGNRFLTDGAKIEIRDGSGAQASDASTGTGGDN